jgi:hypothetical protein
MPPKHDPDYNPWPIVIFVFLFVLIGSFGGAQEVKNYFRSRMSDEKLTDLHYHGEWSVGEYRDCFSVNLPQKEDEKPEVVCEDAFTPAKTFKIKFVGSSTYDQNIADGKFLEWLCRRDNSEISFSCVSKTVQGHRAGHKP